jgi:tRNA-dihydrouridine synthase
MARKHIAWYSKRQRDGNRFRALVNRIESAPAQLAYVCDYFSQLSERQELAA